MIYMKDITKIYNVGGQEVRALDGASLCISEGEFVSIVGPSGSGKSTMMNIIGCLDVADSGEYRLDGQSIEQYSERQLARVRNRKIGFVFQSFNLLSRMSAEENIELPLIYQGLRYGERRRRVDEALERVGLSDRRYHKPTELSGGQQQRVAVARALCKNPSLLLCDEPTGALDIETGVSILRLLQDFNINYRKTVAIITHNAGIGAMADRVIRIRDGVIDSITQNGHKVSADEVIW